MKLKKIKENLYFISRMQKKVPKISWKTVFRGDSWLSAIIQSYPDGANINGVSLPAFPPETVQINTVGSCGEHSIKQAYEFYQSVIDALQEELIELTGEEKVLDFGCGWGRISRFFIKNLSVNNIHGVDVEPSFIDLCKKYFCENNFMLINPFPPSKFKDGEFKLITLYSVFSHLTKEACLAWVNEFYRILKNGGAVAFTTRSLSFLDYCQSLKNTTNPYQKALSQLFDDFENAKSQYQSGEFVHSSIEGVSGGGSKNASFYGETFIPEQYLKNTYCKNLFKNYIRIQPHGKVDQETFILIR
jgi:ubiquinone/menaquinone biosynthesis C-methylase UbiE